MKNENRIPDYNFNLHSGGSLERLMHDQKKLPHMLQTIHPKVEVKKADIDNKNNNIDTKVIKWD